MDDSSSEDVGFRYEWSGDAFTTTQWTYHVTKQYPLHWRLLGIVRRDLTESGPQVHHYVAFENVQHMNRVFTNLEEAKAWVVAATMGAKP